MEQPRAVRKWRQGAYTALCRRPALKGGEEMGGSLKGTRIGKVLFLKEDYSMFVS